MTPKTQHLVKCDRSGRMYPMKDMRKQWNGQWVYKSFYDPRHPQEQPRKIQWITEPLVRPDTKLDDLFFPDDV